MQEDREQHVRCGGNDGWPLHLSSNEAKLYAAILACSVRIGLQQLFNDFGVGLKLRVSMDATAGMAMLKRQGFGTAKRIATQYLWVQERIHAKDMEFGKVGTTENLADLMTKHLTETPMNNLLGRMDYVAPDG